MEHPADGPAYRQLKAKTPARLGWAGRVPGIKTVTMLRFRADHAAAQDSVFSEIGPEFAQKNGLIPVKNLLREPGAIPDPTGSGGGGLIQENSEIIRKSLAQGAKIQLVIGDGLSSAAILANAMDCAGPLTRA